jgi:hypothetical protein
MMSRRRRATLVRASQTVGVVVLAAAMGGSALALVLSRETGLGVGGPLLEDHPARLAFGARVDEDADYSYGGITLTNRDRLPVVLDDVRLEDPRDGMLLLGAYVIPTGASRQAFAFSAGFAGPTERQDGGSELTGYRLEAGKSAQVVVGIRATSPSVASTRAVWVDYSALQRRYQVRFPRSLRFCAGNSVEPCGAALRG